MLRWSHVSPVLGPVSGPSLPARCVSFSCCCYPLAVTSCSAHVPLHFISARSGSLNLRCLHCALVSHVCPGVLQSLPVRVHPRLKTSSAAMRAYCDLPFAQWSHNVVRDFLILPSSWNFVMRSASFLMPGFSQSLRLACGKLQAPTTTGYTRVAPSLHPVIATCHVQMSKRFPVQP